MTPESPAAVVTDTPDAHALLRAARTALRAGNSGEAIRAAIAVTLTDGDYATWLAAADVARRCKPSEARRSIRLAVLGSGTTSQYAQLLRLAVLRHGIAAEIYESDYGVYRQEILDPASRLYAFEPDVVLLAVDEHELQLPELADDADAAVEAEAARWKSLWATLRQRTDVRIVQHSFPIPDVDPFGHLSLQLPGARRTLVRSLNLRLGEAAEGTVLLVDCERLAAIAGARVWFDDRYWHFAKQPVGLGALPLLARNTAAVIAASLGLSTKCLVLDLDNTLWGGVIGEDGLAGISLGSGPVGKPTRLSRSISCPFVGEA